MIRHERRTGAFVSALFLTLFALCMEFVPSAMTASAKSVLSGPATVACSRVRFVGVMGSGENDDPNKATDYGMGGVVSQVYKRFPTAMAGKGIDVSGEGLNYDAVPAWEYPVMQASVDGGVKTLSNILNANRDCVVLAGYSQGAWVIHDTLDDTLNNLPLSARLRVKAVLAFGDPHFDPKARGSIRYGAVPKLAVHDPKRVYEALEAASGFRRAHDFPSWLFGIRSYCKRYDPICSFSETRGVMGGLADCVPSLVPSKVLRGWCAHLDYYGDKATWEQAASWLASLFANLISSAYSAPPTSPRLVTCSDHMKAPWVALYNWRNYGGRSICFEGKGFINLREYDFDEEANSVNIAANVVFYDGAGNQISYGYGYETGDLGSWRGRIVSFQVES